MSGSARILTLDFLKAAAIFFVVIIHAIVYAIFEPDPQLFDELIDRSPIILIALLAPLVVFSSWFSLFIFMNGITIGHSYIKEMNKPDPNYQSVHLKKVTAGFSLIILGSLHRHLFAPTRYTGDDLLYAIITGSIYLDEFVGFNPEKVNGHTTLGSIGFAGIFVSSLFIIYLSRIQYTKKSLKEKQQELRSILFRFAAAVMILGFLLEFIFSRTELLSRAENLHLWLKFFVLFFHGKNTSMIPLLAFGSAGAIFGLMLGNNEYASKRDITVFGMKWGSITFISFLIILPFTSIDPITMFLGTQYPILLFLGNIGIQLMVFVILLNLIDFSSRKSQFQYYFNPFKRFARLSMTIYVLEGLVSVILRRVFLWTMGPDIFPWNFWFNFTFLVTLITMWLVLLKLWEKINYRGSFEWFTVWLMLLFGTVSSRLDPEPGPHVFESTD